MTFRSNFSSEVSLVLLVSGRHQRAFIEVSLARVGSGAPISVGKPRIP
jgi:hypothetical protein